MLSSLCLRLFGGCRVFGPAAVAYFMLAAGAWASLVVEIDDLVLERDYILNSSPEVDGIVARLDATFSGAGWQTGLTIAYALERKTAAGGWEPVVLSGGATAMVTSSSILVGATPQTHSWTVEFLPQSTLAMNTKHRLAVEIRQDGDLLAHGHSEERVLFHFTNTVSNDDPYNIRTAVDAVTLVGGRRHALDTADDETLRGFPLRIDWQYRRWDAFSAFLPSSVSRSFTAEVRLRRQSTGETLQTRIFSKSIAAIPSFVTQPEGRRPFAASDVWEVVFLPTGQINPTLGDLFFEVTIRHVDKITTPIEFFTSNPGFNQPGRFNHANGTMFFGETETILTGFASISAGVLIGSNVLLSISGPQGYLAGAPDLTFNAAGVTANAFINSSGTISVAGLTDSVQVHPFTVAAGTAGGLRFVRSGLTLTTAGLRAHVVARLPQGLGYAADEFTNVLANTVVFENVPFNSGQLPTGVHTLNGNWWFVEETKPVRFRVSALQWHAAQGRFDLTSAPVDNVRYVRASEVAALEAIPPGQLVDSAARLKPSNAGFYKAVLDQSSADFHIRTGNRGDARLHAELVIGAVEFTTHFPLRIEISAVGGGLLTVSDDSVTGGGLFGIGESAVDYRADCGNGGACVAPGVFGGFTIAPEAGTLFFTRDGGLTNRVSVGPAAPGFLNLGEIAWGYDCATAQFTNVFSSAKNGVLLISGHFARGGDLSAGVYPESGSMHALHESGLSRLFGPGILSPVRPSQAGFGRATYWAPGLNFTVSEQPSDLVRAIIGCEAVTYSAKPCNLLYVRA
ncbi:MAG: hypothetical protein JJT96_05010 [Opitutales bacterium]|nr:hypothetical protein [Opitutales bacterium]